MIWSYSFSFTQPYHGWPKEQAERTTRKELDRIVSIDKLVDNMLTYPDAEAIIKRIKEANK